MKTWIFWVMMNQTFLEPMYPGFDDNLGFSDEETE